MPAGCRRSGRGTRRPPDSTTERLPDDRLVRPVVHFAGDGKLTSKYRALRYYRRNTISGIQRLRYPPTRITRDSQEFREEIFSVAATHLRGLCSEAARRPGVAHYTKP